MKLFQLLKLINFKTFILAVRHYKICFNFFIQPIIISFIDAITQTQTLSFVNDLI